MERIQLSSLKEQVAGALREQIFTGAVADGQELTQADVAAQLGVSRIPVRDAFLLLESEGLLQRLPNRHVRVVGLTAERLRQNFSVLAALEAELAVLAQPALAAAVPQDTDDAALHARFAESLQNHMLYQLYTTQRRVLFDGVLMRCPMERPVLSRLNEQILSAMTSTPDELRRAIREYYDTCADHVVKECAL